MSQIPERNIRIVHGHAVKGFKAKIDFESYAGKTSRVTPTLYLTGPGVSDAVQPTFRELDLTMLPNL